MSECDYSTGLNDKYKCKSKEKYDDEYIMHTLRDKHVVEAVLQSSDPKIAIVYGKKHLNGIGRGLWKNGYVVTRRGKAGYGIPTRKYK